MIRVFILFLYALSTSQLTVLMYHKQTPAQDPPLFSFGLIADIQYADREQTCMRYFDKSLDKLDEAIADFNNSDIEFIVNLGDIIEEDYNSYEPVMSVLKKSNKQIYHVLGNHDLSVKWRYKKEVRQMLTGERAYYSFEKYGFRFIVLNTCEISVYSGSPRNAAKARKMIEMIQQMGYPNAFEWNGGIGKEQLDWFLSELETARSKNEKVFVFSHHNIVPFDKHNIYNRDEILNALSGFDNIIAWFSGHDHNGNYGNLNKIHFVTMKGMVETGDSNAWSVVEIYNNRIWIKGRGREKIQILAY